MIESLKEGAWLTSDIIDYIFHLIAAESESTYCFGFYFCEFLSNQGHRGVASHTTNIDIFKFKKLILPVYTPDHWSCVGIDIQKQQITYFDSLRRKNQELLKFLLKYLDTEHQVKRGSALKLSDWSLAHADDIPQQSNSFDCGVFSCKFAQYFARGGVMNFKQEDMSYYRQRFVFEIKKKILMWP